jgi:pimeloyl-ACP methyl ester carboxylesterase
MKFFYRLISIYLNFLAKFSPATAGKHGFLFFCYPIYFASRKERDFLTNSKWFEFEFDSNNIVTYKWGHGPKRILLVHGWQSNSARWEKYIAQFDFEEYTLIAFDSPAQGLSSGFQLNIPKYGKLINHFIHSIPGIHTVIGHSFGAFASLYSFHEYDSSSIEKLILLASPGEVNDFIKYYQNLTGISQSVSDLINRHFVEKYNMDFDYVSAARFATEIDVHGLIVHDLEDDMASVKYANEINEAWKESKLVLTQGKGHSLNYSEVFDIINDYIKNERTASKPVPNKVAAA